MAQSSCELRLARQPLSAMARGTNASILCRDRPLVDRCVVVSRRRPLMGAQHPLAQFERNRRGRPHDPKSFSRRQLRSRVMSRARTCVIAREKGKSVQIEDIVYPTRGPVKRSSRSGVRVCHTDLHYREGSDQRRLPFLLGQKPPASSQGRRRRDVRGPGDYVIIAWRAPCGTCAPAAAADRGTASTPPTPCGR